MVLLHGINDNIMIPHPSYSGVYQDKAKKTRSLQRDEYSFGSETNKKTDKRAVHVSLSRLELK